MTPEDDVMMFLLGLLTAQEDDDQIRHMAYRYLRRHAMRQERAWGPELEELFMMLERGPRPRSRERRMSEAREIAESVLAGFRTSFESVINNRIGEIDSALTNVSTGQDALVRSVAALGSELHLSQWAISCGVDFGKARLVRYVPVRVYLSDPVPEKPQLDKLIRALEELARSLGLIKAEELPEESGSWWKRIFWKTREALNHEEVRKRLEKAERAVEIATLDKPQADANKAQAEAAACVMDKLHDITAACLQFGSLLIIKTTKASGESIMVSRTLTPVELKELEENQTLLGQPSQILEWLECNAGKKGEGLTRQIVLDNEGDPSSQSRKRDQ